ncbi:MAG: DUF4230 domain-containing protein [Clostridia bacterium]|nr:DUF4230 domain-containing protein [Clostridia bacterium]
MRREDDWRYEEERPRRSPLKRFGLWLLKLVTRALAIGLAVVMLPYLARFVASVTPDAASRAATVSAILSHKMAESARLETARITDEGVLSSSVNALFLGEVQNVVIYYTYEASFGIDLSKTQVEQAGTTVVVRLPEVELLLDSLTPTRTEITDFWLRLSERDRARLLQEEQQTCRGRYLDNAEEMAKLRQTAEEALRTTVGKWMGAAGNVTIVYRWGDE